MLIEGIGPYGIFSGYDSKLLTFISGSWRGNVNYQTNVSLRFNVSGTAKLAWTQYTSGSSVSIDGVGLSVPGINVGGTDIYSFSNSNFLNTKIKAGSVIAISIKIYYCCLYILYSQG